MFRLYDDFSVYDDNKEPYSVEIERHTEIQNMHAAVENGEFALKSIGNRFVLNTPRLTNFNFTMNFGFTSIYEFKPDFTIAFGYDKKTRLGQGLHLTYNLDGTISLSYVLICKQATNVVDSITINDALIEEDKRYSFSLCKTDTMLKGEILGQTFSFKVKNDAGYLAIFRNNYIGMCLISDVLITSEDDVKVQVLLEKQTVSIPILNGGDIPYEFSFETIKENEHCYFLMRLSGGTSMRKLNREDRPGQYVAETDIINTPFVRLKNNKMEKKIYFFNDKQVFADPNIYWDCLKKYWKCPELPIERKTSVPEQLFSDDLTITFGYEKFWAKGYSLQSGGPSEFVYDIEGKLLYSGAALTDDIYEIHSPKDKKIVSFINKDCYNYDQVREHLEQNHYFMTDENISLSLVMLTDKKHKYLKAAAQIRDVFDRNIIKELKIEQVNIDEEMGLNKITWTSSSKPMDEGLYRIVYYISYGDTEIKKQECVFEVLNPESDVTPALASGLPYAFSMPNEQKWLERNSFDLWNPMPSCDVEHYISIVTDTPIEAENRRVWEVLAPFKRKWFAWLDNRTCLDWQIESHMDIVKNCDYLHCPAPIQLYPMRNDFFLLQTYTYNPKIMSLLKDFLDENPDIKNRLSFNLDNKVVGNAKELIFELDDEEESYLNYDNIKEIFEVCRQPWFDFALKHIREELKNQNEELRKINPKLKRSCYGPFNQYANCTLSYHTMRAYGMIPDDGLKNDVYTGFTVFEDYPYSCCYQTYRGAFGVMTTLLHIPELVIYPEQYEGSSLGGCIDGAVKFSNSPMGQYNVEPYQNSTHAFEYVFNTPRREKDGYRYWNTYGFHRPDYNCEMWDKLVKDWKYVLDYRPVCPLKTVGFVAEYYDSEDVFDMEIKSLHNTACVKNRSEQGHGVLYECCREAGLNAGFATKFETLPYISASECDILILPTLKECSADAIKEVRRLYNEGTVLIAVSDISGLEDIFGVCQHKQTVSIDTVCYEGNIEHVHPMDAEFLYENKSAEVLMTTEDGMPIILKNRNALLINACVVDIGYESFEGMPGKGRRCISEMLRKCIKHTLRELSTQEVLGEGVGITLFKTQKGDTVLLAIDYTAFDNKEHGLHRVGCDLKMSNVKNVKSDRKIICLRDQDGDIERIEFNILPHESVFIELIL